ncbi:hypothetical protein DYB36_005196 [Aphanomyces astaci]|uniref:ABC transmembrane type-1 domain-containing protein n=1 Tax=Aphanomyces astaci TaxID=112090 RepID=A0A397B7E9_APHAT|nr:hypothetical protein DYB36_005196 [Aphanomyces astaci]
MLSSKSLDIHDNPPEIIDVRIWTPHIQGTIPQTHDALLRAPTTFFDTTPLSWILNYYSNDLNTVDTTILFCVSGHFGAVTNALFALDTKFWMTLYVDLIALRLLYTYVTIGQFYIQLARTKHRHHSEHPCAL